MIRQTYSWLFKTFIHRTDPEMAHHLGITAIEYAGKCALTRGLMRATIGHFDDIDVDLLPERRKVYIGRRLVRHRLGLAAGMDKDACAVLGLTALGFGFVEVGTITPKAQPGNEGPRLWRLMESQGLRNRMGFNNEGADAAGERLKKLRSTKAGRAAIVGANIGKNKVTPAEDAPADYEYCARQLSPWVDFVIVNVSSPNTPGLRDLQSVDSLRLILQAARKGCEEATDRPIPLFVKIAPDLADEDIVDICALTRELGVAGVVATNTTINHDLGDGGVSGAPLRERALDVVRLVASNLDDEQILIGAGGIFTSNDAHAMLSAGADLVEAFTAFIYEGPSWPGEVNRELAKVRP